ncbi:MAG: translation initiation factor IF-1 [Patescibacteria group bacterium]
MAQDSQDKVILVGTVVESLPDTHFRVQLDDGKLVLAYLTGKMKYNRIRILVGDTVEIQLDAHGGKPRLIRRR